MMILDDRVVPPLIKVLQTGILNPTELTQEVYNTILNFLLSFRIANYAIETFDEDGIHLDVSAYGHIIVENPEVEAVKEKLCWFANNGNRFRGTPSDMMRDFGIKRLKQAYVL